MKKLISLLLCTALSAAVMDVMGYYSWSKYPDSAAYNYYEK